MVMWDSDLLNVQADILEGAWGEAVLTLLHHHSDSPAPLLARLAADGFDPKELSVVPAKLTGPWIRDYGPLFVRTADGVEILDLHYAGDPPEDTAPTELATFYPSRSVLTLDFDLDGGNILSDGAGRCVSTYEIVLLNSASERDVREVAREWLGCDDLILVPNLAAEPTGHVDMFVHLSGPGRALVGAYSPAIDEENAQRLDEAAQILRQRGFKVSRVPMPSNEDGIFRSYVNATVVNGVVLIPVYAEEASNEQAAVEAFEEAYPQRRLRRIESDLVIQREGAVHCVTATIPRLD
jgi:agmatine deiminase